MKCEFIPSEDSLIFRVNSDDLITLLMFEEYVERMLIDLRYDTNLEINFHTTCYVCEKSFIFEATITKSEL